MRDVRIFQRKQTLTPNKFYNIDVKASGGKTIILHYIDWRWDLFSNMIKNIYMSYSWIFLVTLFFLIENFFLMFFFLAFIMSNILLKLPNFIKVVFSFWQPTMEDCTGRMATLRTQNTPSKKRACINYSLP